MFISRRLGTAGFLERGTDDALAESDRIAGTPLMKGGFVCAIAYTFNHQTLAF